MPVKDGLIGGLLWSILILAGCGTSRGAAAAQSESPRPTDPPAGTIFYKGRTIVFDETAVPPLLAIDGKSIKVLGTGTGKYAMYDTSIFPYATFTSLWQLARALVGRNLVANATGR
jgi:hypothetical protein